MGGKRCGDCISLRHIQKLLMCCGEIGELISDIGTEKGSDSWESLLAKRGPVDEVFVMPFN